MAFIYDIKQPNTLAKVKIYKTIVMVGVFQNARF